MSNLITNKLREHVCGQLIESIIEPANNVYYLLASKHTPYANGDSFIPTPQDSFIEVEQKIYEEGIFAKKVNYSDVMSVVSKHVWSSNTIYDTYDHEDEELFSKQFYVAVDGGSTYYIYKCLDNNRGVASIEQPASTSESACSFITTSDGYTWKLMYTMSEGAFEKFATDDYMPVTTSANVAGNTVSGAIDVIKIESVGSNYVAQLTGQFQVDDLREAIPAVTGNTTTYRLTTSASANANFYTSSAIYISSGTGAGQIRSINSYNPSTRVAVVNTAFTVAPSSDSTYIISPNVIINGDGTGATAYATVSSNSSVNNFISKVNMISRGSGYTYATAVVAGNTGGVSNNAVLRVIVPPVGGHGKDALNELGVKGLGISVSYNTNESGFITVENDYRKLALIKDPLINNVTLTLDNEVGTFTTGETVYQISYKTLVGTSSGNTTTTTIAGTGTQFDNALLPGDYVYITDTVTNLSCIRVVDAITNATTLSLTDELPFITSFATLAHATIIANGVKTGNSSPYLTMSNATPKFITGKTIVGGSSGAVAEVTGIDVNEKSYNNWSTLDNRTRIAYTALSGSIPEDSPVYQTFTEVSNASFHSANNTYVFLTSEKGTINADPSDPLQQANGSGFYTLGSIKYPPDIVKGSGQVLYIENNSPISRSISQSETIRLVIKL